MATEVRGIVAREVGKPAPIEQIVLEDPGPGEVLVRVLASGVCHTDLHFQLGSIGTLPILMGHEGAGVVEAVGAGVTSPKVGDYVVLAWRAPCGQCRFCRIGQPHLCAASLNAVPRQKTPSGETHPDDHGPRHLRHAHRRGGAPGRADPARGPAGPGLPDRLRRDDRPRRRLLHGRRQEAAAPSPSSARAPSAPA